MYCLMYILFLMLELASLYRCKWKAIYLLTNLYVLTLSSAGPSCITPSRRVHLEDYSLAGFTCHVHKLVGCLRPKLAYLGVMLRATGTGNVQSR